MLVVLLLGMVLRMHGLVWTLPWHFHGDEDRVVSNGISVYEVGVQSYTSDITSMANYPPLRSWEIVTTRGLLLLFFGEIDTPTQILFGRLVSLGYALLTMVFLYHLGKQLTHDPKVGIMAAAIFAVWPETIEFGQRVVVDGAGLAFFVLSAWLAVRAIQRLSYRDLVWATVAGGIAALGKYNYATVLLIPATFVIFFAIQQPRATLIRVIAPAAFLSAVIGFATLQTISLDDIYFNYLNQDAQLEDTLRGLSFDGFQPGDAEWQQAVTAQPITAALRFEWNTQVFLDFTPSVVAALALVGMLYASSKFGQRFDRTSLWVLFLFSLGTLVVFSLFRIVEGRQLFGSIVILIVIAALVLVELYRYSRVTGVLLTAAILVPLAIDAWDQNTIYTQPDTRVETARWFMEHAQAGTGIAVENIPYEFRLQNGYPEDAQHFNAERVYRLNDRAPKDWENQGYYYLVADASYAWRGAYYAGHVFQEEFDAGVEVLARFEGADYAGPDRIIMRAFRPETYIRADFGDVATLYGYDYDEQASETINYKIYWQAQQPTNTDYVLFNHLMNLDTGEFFPVFDRLIGHNGANPTSTWEANQWLFDEFELERPADLPSGRYQLVVGLYNPVDGTRLPVNGDPVGTLELFQIESE